MYPRHLSGLGLDLSMFATSPDLRKAELLLRCLRTGESAAVGAILVITDSRQLWKLRPRPEWSVDLAQVAQNTGGP